MPGSPPAAMNAMNAAEPGSTGAPEMSRFHQLDRGKSGSGGGTGPLWAAAEIVRGVAIKAARKKESRRTALVAPRPGNAEIRLMSRPHRSNLPSSLRYGANGIENVRHRKAAISPRWTSWFGQNL